jgi:RNA polymerase sigma factor (sigma-70 family)|nr:MAG TPA: DNA directed RNA polymerase subunit [Caudoviricetes sp.]
MDKNKLIEENLNLIPYIYNHFVTKDDLVKRWREDILQEGYLGLVRAANAYNPDSSFSFTTLSHISVKRAMWSFIRILHNQNVNLSLDKEIRDDDHGIVTVGELIEDTSDIESEFIDKETSTYNEQLFDQVLLLCPPKRKEIIELYYHGYKTKQIIDLLQVSKSYTADVVKQEIRLFKLYIDIIENDEKAPKLDTFKYKKDWCKAFKSYVKNTLKISLMDVRLNKTVR